MLTVAASSPFDTINGLPVHALVVHAVVVLLPLAAIGAIAIAIVPKLSLRFGVLVWLGALAAFGAALVAERAGRVLEQRVGLPEEHAQHANWGEQVKFYAAALAVVSFLMWIIDRRTAGHRSTAAKIIAIVLILAGVAALYGVFRAGDSGSRAVWEQEIQNSPIPPS